MSWRYSDGDPRNRGVGRNRNSEPISGFTVCCQCCMVPQVVTLIAGSKRQNLLMVGDDDEIFMTRSLNAMPKTTEQHFIAHSDKSVAYVTNNKRLLDVLYIEANY